MRSLKGKRVLITGGAGFIGSHLAEVVLKEGAAELFIVDNFFVGKEENLAAIKENKNVVVFKEDACDLNSMEAIIRRGNIQVVYNLATMALIYSFFNPHTACMLNVRLMDTLLNLLRGEKFETLIHVSSSEAYGAALYAPMDEGHPLNPTTPYAAGKAAADLMLKSFYNLYNHDTVIVRPFNNYGPRQNIEGPLAGIIPLTVRRILAGEKPVIEGDGSQTRDYIYVADTVRGLIAAYNNENIRGETINLGSGAERRISDIVKKICEHLGYAGPVEHTPARQADVKRLCASTKKAESLLHFSPEISFENGLAKTLNWYMGKKR
ncbi:MAG: GDP-mannose 4,6-dehydratase [Oscillospiraceae bacterium]|jgi:UDP-glucose 4-epimerase|nr:GDP-mannose 4,6-dehydratase [Oscillospiraceae bacterium]